MDIYLRITKLIMKFKAALFIFILFSSTSNAEPFKELNLICQINGKIFGTNGQNSTSVEIKELMSIAVEKNTITPNDDERYFSIPVVKITSEDRFFGKTNWESENGATNTFSIDINRNTGTVVVSKEIINAKYSLIMKLMPPVAAKKQPPRESSNQSLQLITPNPFLVCYRPNPLKKFLF